VSEEVIKILTAIIIFAVAVGAGLLPLRMGATKRGDVILMLGLAFAGGVFLAGGLVHLLVDGMESFEELGMGEGFPLAFAICGLGLLAVLLFEKVAAAGTEESTAVSASGRQPYLLLIVLSAHSVIAGASLGLQTSGSAFLMILLAILAHKGFAAFSLGVSFMRGGLARQSYRRLLLFFACTTPVGLLLGTLASSALSGTAALWFEAVFDSLAAGTFLYVATMDLMHDVFEEVSIRARKYAASCVGFGLMSMLAIWA
jgi:zinc transporter 1/2/3